MATRRINQDKLQRISEKLRDVDWHDLSLIGTELGEIDTIRRQPFQFSDFIDALDEGFLSKLDHPVYVFLQTEPVYFPEGIILTVPVLIAYSSAVPPPNLVARDSVQSEDAVARALNPFGGRPEPMSKLKMEWKPYIPENVETDTLTYILNGAVKPPVYVLDWEVRQQKASRFSEMEANAIKFINPYVILPKVFKALEKPEVTSVSFEYKYNDKSYEVIFDKETDGSLAEFIPAYLSDNELPETPCAKEIEAKIKETFAEYKKIRDEQWDETMALLGQYNDDQIKLLNEAKVYKFYPRHPKYDLSSFVSKRVNRYFKDADEVFGGKKIEKDEMSESDIEEFERFEKAEEKRLKDLEIAQEKERRRLERAKMMEIEKSKTKEERAAERKAKREEEKKKREEEKKKKMEEKKAAKEEAKKKKEEEKKEDDGNESDAEEEEEEEEEEKAPAKKKAKKSTVKKGKKETVAAAKKDKNVDKKKKTTKPAKKVEEAKKKKEEEKKKKEKEPAAAAAPATPKKKKEEKKQSSAAPATPKKGTEEKKKQGTPTPKKGGDKKKEEETKKEEVVAAAAAETPKKRKREATKKSEGEPKNKKSKK